MEDKSLLMFKKHIKFFHEEDKFDENHYSIFATEKVLKIDFVIEDQFSGNCWSDEIFKPKKYKVKNSLNSNAIKILLASILLNPKKGELRAIVKAIEERLIIKNKTIYGYYGNYTKYQSFEIKINTVYELIREIGKKEKLILRFR